MSIFDRFRNLNEDPDTSTLWTTPWRWRTADGVYVGWNGTVWMYRAFDLHPISPDWEDPAEQLSVQRRLQNLLVELGETSREAPPGLRSTVSDYREVHLVGITWEDDAQPPDGTPDELSDYMGEFLGFAVPRKTVLVGVRLRRAGLGAGLPGGSKKLLEQLKAQISTLLAEDVPPLELYMGDIELFDSLVSRNRGRVPTEEELRQLESWYNLGRSPDALVFEERNHLRIEEIDKIELAAVVDFSTVPRYAPFFQWAAEAEAHAEGVRMISVRAELEPAVAARRRARNSQRRVRSQIDEERASGDIDRPEYSDTMALAQAVEEHFMTTNEPLLTKCSIVLARRATNADETYIDYLRNYFGIEVRPLTMRQLPALEETLPCARARVNPFLQDVTIGMISYAGMLAHSDLGDPKGVYLGLTQPNHSLAFLDLLGAPARNKTPICAIFGEPGSGKTFLAQSISYQAVLSGLPVIFINPKGHDSLANLARLAGGQVVSMSKMASTTGAFDPFRYEDPEIAAEILGTHILSVMDGFTEKEELRLTYGLVKGAESGARCAADALRAVGDREIVSRVLEQVRSSALFALGFGFEPVEQRNNAEGLTLIEFDRKLDLPDPHAQPDTYKRQQRIALGAISLVTRASLSVLARAGGGVMVLDEAWTFLSHPSGMAAMQQLGREGRSLNVLPIFATQRVSDLVGSDMEGYISRVFCMQMRDEREATAALQICGLEPSAARLRWLSEAGPQPRRGSTPARWAMALHRDLDNRHAALLLGPTPQRAYEAFTTNPEERKELRKRQTGTGDQD
jgi:hypothetical protein